MLADAFGQVPAAAIYEPVDSRETIFASINENLQNIPAAQRHIAAVNRLNEDNDIVRITAFSPEFMHVAHKSSSTIKDLIHGKAPIDTVTDVLTDDICRAPAQLIQASLQNENNAAAAGDPSKFGQLQIELQKLTTRIGQEAQRGYMINQFVPNYAALLQPQINSISEGLFGAQDRTAADTGGATQGVGQGNTSGLQRSGGIFPT